MPTYDYECQACGHTFEVFQSINDSAKRKCPECGRLKLKRLIGTGAAIMFKGSGFYQTDYRSESYKKAAKAEQKSQDSSAKSDSGSKSDGKSPSSSGSKGGSGSAKSS